MTNRLIFAGALVALAACSTTTIHENAGGPGGPTATEDGGPALDPDDPANQPPHSLGTIVLGESHAASNASVVQPVVSAVFVPDAKLSNACAKKLDAACELRLAPKCTVNPESPTGCESGEACSFNDSCAPVCKKIAQCETACETDEVCTLAGTASEPNAGTCVKLESFDAGPLAFSGTTTPITMFPPYKFESKGQGAPFLGGAEIKVQAQGATGAGFDKFDETFTATTFLQTTPSLSKIPRDKVFGTGTVPIAWAPGQDTIVVTVSGAGGSAVCKTQDALGTYEIPRAVVVAAQGDPSTTSTSTVSISVARQRKTVTKDKHAKGQLKKGTVIEEGWLELVTTSIESASFQGCAGAKVACGSGSSCADLQTDRENCGACGNACDSSEVCGGGKCDTPANACRACIAGATSGACKAQASACTADSACNSLYQCLNACTTDTCAQNCQTTYSAGATKFVPFQSCLQTACAASCSGGG